jgi:hypothetical protein
VAAAAAEASAGGLKPRPAAGVAWRLACLVPAALLAWHQGLLFPAADPVSPLVAAEFQRCG